jgi:hypothetical protein
MSNRLVCGCCEHEQNWEGVGAPEINGPNISFSPPSSGKQQPKPNALWNPRYLKAYPLSIRHYGCGGAHCTAIALPLPPSGTILPVGARGTPAATHAARPRAPSLAGGDGTGEPLRGCARAATASSIPGARTSSSGPSPATSTLKVCPPLLFRP